MANIPGTQSWNPGELKAKEAVMAEAPKPLIRLVKTHLQDEYQIVEASHAEPQIEFAYQMDAMNHLLALLNFPDKLRGFLSGILGLAKYESGYEFAATNFQLGIRLRTGREDCSDESAEKWVTRKKQALEHWMSSKSFLFVKITKGEFDFENNRNKPTKYKVYFNRYVIETVQLAKSISYWRDGAAYAKHQGRALREAARKVLQKIPEAPPLKPTKIKIIPEDIKFDRRHKTIVSFLEKNRDVLVGMNLAPEEYFMFLVQKVIDPIAFNPSGTTGRMLTPEGDQPDRRGGILRRIERGTLFAEELGYTGDEFNETVNNVMGEDSPYTGPQTAPEPDAEPAAAEPENDPMDKNVPPVLKHEDTNDETPDNSLKTNVKHRGDIFVSDGGTKPPDEAPDGWTNLSAGSADDFDLNAAFDDFEDFPAENKTQTEDEYMDVKEVQIIVENWRAEVIRKVPPITSDQRFAGAWEISWQSFGGEPKRTEDALNFAILKTARSNRALENLRKLFVEYVIARIAYVKGGVPYPKDDKKLDAMRGKLTTLLIIPDTDSS